MSITFFLSDAEKQFLSHQARRSIKARLAGKSVADVPQPPADQFAPESALWRTLGAFVTLIWVRGFAAALAILWGVSRCMLLCGIWRRRRLLQTRVFPH